MKGLLVVYLSGTLGLFLWFFAYAIRKLDRYDWQYNKGDIFTSFFIAPWFWPLPVLLNPKGVRHPAKFFRPHFYDLAANNRERDRILSMPIPVCGKLIRYRQDYAFAHDGIQGEYILPSAAVEEYLIRELNNNPHLYHGDQGEILQWVRQRDETIETHVDVPERWRKFEFIADDVSREKPVTVRCLACNTTLGKDEVVYDDDKNLHHGWNYRRQKCRAGHNLLIIEAMHIYAPPKVHDHTV